MAAPGMMRAHKTRNVTLWKRMAHMARADPKIGTAMRMLMDGPIQCQTNVNRNHLAKCGVDFHGAI